MLDPGMVGHRYPDTPPYEVSREKIREFAEALADDNPLYIDRGAAREAGHRDVIAPPTFAVVITQPANRQPASDPAIGLDLRRVVHGEQRLIHYEPLYAGDIVTASVLVTEIRQAGNNWLLTTETDLVRITDRRRVCTSKVTLVERGDGS
jgi:acyl dehydratase